MPTQANSGAAAATEITLDVELESGAECQVWSDRKLKVGEDVILWRSDDAGSNYDHKDTSAGADGVLLNSLKGSNSFRGPGYFRVIWPATTFGDRILYVDT